MNTERKSTIVLVGLTVLFLALAAGFGLQLWGRVPRLTPVPAVDPKFTNTATVRLSAAEVIRNGEDASGMDCYACHEKTKPVQIHLDASNHVVLPKEHQDLVMMHGRNNRNDNCFTCHDSENLVMLKTPDGHKYKLTESTMLCASCHGPTYRDWEAGIHGRTSGYWARQLGSNTRVECASCHHPHSPAFPSLTPAPGPHQLHPVAAGNNHSKQH